MLFNSIEYLVFLPIVFIIYWYFANSKKIQNIIILLSSYVFYGWWDWKFLLLIAFTSVCSYFSGILIGNVQEQRIVNQKLLSTKWIAIGNVVLNLFILGLFKYYNFFIGSLTNIAPGIFSDKLLIKIILPVGISFYTFQALSYTLDVYRKKIEPTYDIVAFLAYVSFFPQLVAGPIERATNLLPQFSSERRFCYPVAVDGLRQILWGLFKKMVVADNCALFVDLVWKDINGNSGSTLILAAILFSFQIYGDFSGYSDIAIGSAKLFGIKLMRNFNVPYFSRDIAEFWRKWHISLTTWFRDYIYIPLGGNRVSKRKVVRNTFIIFLVSGLWHGANWTFIAWGAYHAFLFLPLILLKKNRRYLDVVAATSLFPNLKELFQIVLTFILVVFGWIIFRSESITQALGYFISIYNNGILKKPMLSVSFVFVLVMMIVEWVNRKKEHGLNLDGVHNKFLRYSIYYLLIFVIYIFNGHQDTFIYFQF